MSKFSEYIGSQFGNPRGIIGWICCKLMNSINRKMYKKTVSLLQLSENEKLLDVGYGNGLLLQLIFRNFNCKLWGIDISEDMRKLALKRNKCAVKAGKINLSVGDCCKLEFLDNTFNAITSVNTVYFWTDTQKGLSEIYRCLVPGGCFINVVYTKEWLDKLKYTEKGFKKFEPEELYSLGKQTGFSQVEVIEITKNKSFAVLYRK
ncbi:MAG: class I SAM-dependent methyltransferase [Bacteroidales bacterium]|nr:class I SAM-dependent methyltransferase [Bacteroidales bacterium]